MNDYTHYFPNANSMLELHNNARKVSWLHNLPVLKNSDILEKYASEWAKYMADTNVLRHSTIRDIMDLGFSRAGENIAYGQKDEKSVMQSWMNSYGHKRNIMNKHYTHMGFGFSYSENSTPYWCVCFGKKKD